MLCPLYKYQPANFYRLHLSLCTHFVQVALPCEYNWNCAVHHNIPLLLRYYPLYNKSQSLFFYVQTGEIPVDTFHTSITKIMLAIIRHLYCRKHIFMLSSMRVRTYSVCGSYRYQSTVHLLSTCPQGSISNKIK